MQGPQSLEGCLRYAARLQAIGAAGLRRAGCGIGCTSRQVGGCLFGRVLPRLPQGAVTESGRRTGAWSAESASAGRARKVLLARGRTRRMPSPRGRGEASSTRERVRLTLRLPITS